MKYLDYEGLSYLWNKIKSYITSKHFAGSAIDGGPANKAVSIPFGQVDSTSTATAFTATVDGITELRDGVCVYLRNGAVTSASGYTININNLGAKPVYTTMSATSASTTQFNVNYTMLFVYNSTRVSGGCWDMFYGYYFDTDITAYNIRESIIRKPVKSILYKYQFVFTCMDGTLLPANSDNGVTAATHVLTKESFNPWGQIYYHNNNAVVNAGSTPASNSLVSQASYSIYPDLRYSFNTASTLVANNDIYIKCIPQPDGSAILADSPIVFALPTYEDGFIYKRLGKAYDTYRIILEQDKPVYYYKDGIKLWTGYNLQEGVMVTDEFTKKDSKVTSDVRVKSVGGKTVVWNQLVSNGDFSDGTTGWEGLLATITVSDNIATIVTNQRTSSGFNGIRTTVNFVVGHKYYISLNTTSQDINNCVIYSGNSSGGYGISISVPIGYVRQIFTYSTSANNYFTVSKPMGILNPVTFTLSSLKIIDLTQMFGTGNEPTLEEFEAMFPEDSYAYDAGRIVNVAMSGMKSLDADGNDLDSAELDVTTLTGVADGGSTSEIIFPNGMNGIGDVRDEIDLVNGRAVKRIGVVDLGTLNLGRSNSNQQYFFVAVVQDMAPAFLSWDRIKGLLCVNYLVGTGLLDTETPDKTITKYTISTSNETRIYIRDDSYTDATTFKAAMSGVMLYYELATPIEYTLDTTPSCVMSVVKGGKEMILPYNASEPQCAPVKVVEEYKVDYVSNKVVKNLEDRIAALEAIINNG